MKIALSDNQKRMYSYYIELFASVLNNTKPQDPPQNFDWQFFCKHAQRNSVLNILSYAIENLRTKPEETVIKVAENEKMYYIIKETSQLIEVEKVLREFDKAQIKNIPLKGYFLKNMYPQSDFRTMTDVDILVDKNDFKKIENIFLNLGFNSADIIKFDEIHFQKDLTYFEMQTQLGESGNNFFENIWERSALRDEYDFSYSLSKEDFYVYLIYHCAKHFKSGGLGIRMVMDIYIFLVNNSDLDFEYLNNAFKELNLIEFEHHFRATALNWFSNEKTQITQLGEFILYCSTFGVRNICFYQDHQNTKGNYWLKQFFRPYSKMRASYKYLDKFPFLLPVSWVQYWFTRIFIIRDLNLKEGLKSRAENLSDENSEFMKNLTKQLNI